MIRVPASALAIWLGLLLLGNATRLDGQTLEDYDDSNLGLRAFGVEATRVNASNNEATIGVGLRFDLGFLGPYIRLVPRGAWWRAEVDASAVQELERQLEEVSDLEPGSIQLGSLDRTAWIAGADLQWTLHEAVLAPYLGLGLEVYFLDDDGAAIESTFLDSTVITVGASGVVGAELNFARRWRGYGELRGSLVTDASNVALAVGLAYRF